MLRVPSGDSACICAFVHNLCERVNVCDDPVPYHAAAHCDDLLPHATMYLSHGQGLCPLCRCDVIDLHSTLTVNQQIGLLVYCSKNTHNSRS